MFMMFGQSFLSMKMISLCGKKFLKFILRGTAPCRNALWEHLGI